MDEPRVRGELFHQLVQYINKKWGSSGLEKIGVTLEEHKPDAWYPLADFCDCMDDLYKILGITDLSEPFRIGRWMVTSNHRWAAVFAGKDPGEVFMGNSNQKKEYDVGDFKGSHQMGKEVNLHTTIWTTDKRHLDLWAEFYRGRLQGVLELTGAQGEVSTISEMFEKEATVSYKITWY